MSKPTTWYYLSVREFVSQNNWQGKQLLVSRKPQLSSQALTVQQFFRNNNWQGLPQIDHSEPATSTVSQLPPASLVLALSVSKFFQSLDWEGQPEIAPFPKRQDSPELVPFDNVTITNFSNLF